MDRFQFTHNPSSCEASAARLDADRLRRHLRRPRRRLHRDRLQALPAAQLPAPWASDPKLGLRLRGGSRRGGYPSLRATFASRGPKDSNLKRIEVTMPHAAVPRPKPHPHRLHPRRSSTPSAARRARSTARPSPTRLLFDEPLRGNVYLRSSSGKAPRPGRRPAARGAIRIVVEGRIGPGQQRRHQHLLRQPPRRADRPLHDDVRRR